MIDIFERRGRSSRVLRAVENYVRGNILHKMRENRTGPFPDLSTDHTRMDVLPHSCHTALIHLPQEPHRGGRERKARTVHGRKLSSGGKSYDAKKKKNALQPGN